MVIICNFCNKQYASYSSRSNHIKKFHTNNVTKTVSNVTKNEVHVTENVPNVTTFTCKKCNETMNVLPTAEELAKDFEYKERVDQGFKSLIGLVLSFFGVVLLANLLITLFG